MFWEEKIEHLKKIFAQDDSHVFEDLYLRGKHVRKKLERKFVIKEWNPQTANLKPLIESLNHKVHRHAVGVIEGRVFLDEFLQRNPICFIDIAAIGKVYKVSATPLFSLIAIIRGEFLIFDIEVKEVHAIVNDCEHNA